MDDWHYVLSGQRNGPISKALLIRKIQEGQFASDIYVWREGMADWKKASEIPELSPRPEPPPIPGSQLPPIPKREEPYAWKDPDADKLGVAKAPERVAEQKEKPKKKGWGGTILVVVVGLIAVVIGKGMGKIGGEAITEVINESQKDSAIEQGLRQAAAQMKKDLPKRVDAITTLTDVTVSGKTIFYYMQVADTVDATAVQNIKDSIQKLNQQRTCAAKSKDLIEDGGKMVWRYSYRGATIQTATVSSCP